MRLCLGPDIDFFAFIKLLAIIFGIRIPSQKNAQKHCFVKVFIFRKKTLLKEQWTQGIESLNFFEFNPKYLRTKENAHNCSKFN